MSESNILIVLSQLNKNKNTLSDVKKLSKIFWGEADVLATTEITISTNKKWLDKYFKDVEKIASGKGYDLEVIKG